MHETSRYTFLPFVLANSSAALLSLRLPPVTIICGDTYSTHYSIFSNRSRGFYLAIHSFRLLFETSLLFKKQGPFFTSKILKNQDKASIPRPASQNGTCLYIIIANGHISTLLVLETNLVHTFSTPTSFALLRTSSRSPVLKIDL